MITEKVKELESLRQKAAELEQQIARERAAELAALPRQYGFERVEDFIEALLVAAGGRRRRGNRDRGRPARTGGSSNGSGRRPRARITDETRAEVKKLVEAGKTGAEIAKTVGISLPSVQNIKKALGLVSGRAAG